MSINVNQISRADVPQGEENQVKNISYKANPNNSLERMPDEDTFNSNKSKKTIIGAAVATLVTAMALLGVLTYRKGSPAEGETKKIIDRFKDGWKELWTKGVKKAAPNQEVNELNAIIDRLTNELNTKNEEVKTLQKNAEKIEEKLKDALAKEGELTDNAKKFQEKLDGLKKVIANKEKEIADKEQELKDLREKLKNVPDKLKDLRPLDFSYEMKFEGNKVTVENGVITKLINSNGDEWKIDENTGKDFVARLNKAIEIETNARTNPINAARPPRGNGGAKPAEAVKPAEAARAASQKGG